MADNFFNFQMHNPHRQRRVRALRLCDLILIFVFAFFIYLWCISNIGAFFHPFQFLLLLFEIFLCLLCSLQLNRSSLFLCACSFSYFSFWLFFLGIFFIFRQMGLYLLLLLFGIHLCFLTLHDLLCSLWLNFFPFFSSPFFGFS